MRCRAPECGEAVLRAVTERARCYFRSELGLEAATVGAPPGAIEAPASFLCFKGAVCGTLILQAGPGTVRELLVRMTGGGCTAEDEALLLAEALNEVLNIVAGNVTRELAEAGLRVRIEPPFAAVWDGRPGAPLAGEQVRSRYLLRTSAGDFLFALAAPDRRDSS